MSRAGEHTPLSPDKGETQSDERESERIKPAGDGDQQKGTHYCGHHQAAMVAGGTPGMQGDTPSRARLSEEPCTRSEYGSVDAVTVCLSCQHLYAGAREVVLSPSRLERDAFTPSPASPTSHKDFSMHRPWKVRRYEGLCDCGATVSGGACVCPGRTSSGTLHGLLPNSSPCLRKVKIAALVLAALLPWAFLVAYVVLYYT